MQSSKPGSGHDFMVYQHMLRHHENLQNVQSTISGLSRAMTPPLRGAFAHNIRQQERLIEAENHKICEKMKGIIQTPRTYIHHPRSVKTMNLLKRKEEVLRRASENQQLLKCLRNVQPTYRKEEWKEHAENTEKYKQLNTRFRTRADPLILSYSRKSLNTSTKLSLRSPSQASFEVSPQPSQQKYTPRSPLPSLVKGMSSASTRKLSPLPKASQFSLLNTDITPPKQPAPQFVRRGVIQKQSNPCWRTPSPSITQRRYDPSSQSQFTTRKPEFRTSHSKPDLEYKERRAQQQLEHLQRLDQSRKQSVGARKKLEFDLNSLDFRNLDSAFEALKTFVDHCKEVSDEYASNNEADTGDEKVAELPLSVTPSQIQTNSEFGKLKSNSKLQHEKLRSVEQKNYLTQQGLFRFN